MNIRQHRDISKKEYKRQFHVANDGNYMLAIYEDVVKGKVKRDYELVKTIDAAEYYKQSNGNEDLLSIVPSHSQKGYPLKHKLTIGKHVLLYEESPDEMDFDNPEDIVRRLYKITGLSYLPVGSGYGNIVMRHHQEARMAKDVKTKNGAFKNGEEYRASILMLHTQFHALVEGEDFRIDSLGKITQL